MRKIEPKMVSFLDAKLAGNGSAQDAIKNQEARNVFIYAMEACVGIREVGGNNEGPLVDLIQETIGGEGVEPWCMALVQTCIAYAELKTGVVSPVYDGDMGGEHCLTVWNKTPETQRVKYFPGRGAIIIWRHGKTTSGHTGMFVEGKLSDDTFKAVEGNTESGVANGKVERDGGGVYRTIRKFSGNGDMKILGYLKPF